MTEHPPEKRTPREEEEHLLREALAATLEAISQDTGAAIATLYRKARLSHRLIRALIIVAMVQLTTLIAVITVGILVWRH